VRPRQPHQCVPVPGKRECAGKIPAPGMIRGAMVPWIFPIAGIFHVNLQDAGTISRSRTMARTGIAS
jgi:hypothetical protein